MTKICEGQPKGIRFIIWWTNEIYKRTKQTVCSVTRRFSLEKKILILLDYHCRKMQKGFSVDNNQIFWNCGPVFDLLLLLTVLLWEWSPWIFPGTFLWSTVSDRRSLDKMINILQEILLFQYRTTPWLYQICNHCQWLMAMFCPIVWIQRKDEFNY